MQPDERTLRPGCCKEQECPHPVPIRVWVWVCVRVCKWTCVHVEVTDQCLVLPSISPYLTFIIFENLIHKYTVLHHLYLFLSHFDSSFSPIPSQIHSLPFRNFYCYIYICSLPNPFSVACVYMCVGLPLDSR